MKIIAVKRNESGDNIAFKLDDNRIVDLDEAISLCNNGELPDYNVGTSKAGTNFIRGNADGEESNNLDSLPTFE